MAEWEQAEGEATCFQALTPEAKRCPEPVALMCWSPRMDLVAVATTDHQLLVYRLSWQKVWALKDEEEISALQWRPDGKILAVACGSVLRLHDIESGETVHEQTLSAAVTCLDWIAESESASEKDADSSHYQNDHQTFLQSLPAPPQSSDTGFSHTNPRLASENETLDSMNILIVGTGDSRLQLFALGVFDIGFLKLGEALVPMQLTISSDLRSVVAVGMHDSEMRLFQFQTAILCDRRKELHAVARECGHISVLMHYLSETLQSMDSAWATILMELDKKLSKFATGQGPNVKISVRDEFLALLLRGTASLELEAFLTTEMTNRKLKKLGSSVESSYSNIQDLILEHLHQVCDALMFRLGELQGLARWTDRFGGVGLNEKDVHECIQNVGTVALKADELLRAIDVSRANFKAFFAWLSRAIQSLESEPQATKTSKIESHQVAEFIRNNFRHFPGQGEEFSAETIGQYFRLQKLRRPQAETNPEWQDVVRGLAGSAFIFPSHRDRSLAQVVEALRQSVDIVFRHSCTDACERTADTLLVAGTAELPGLALAELPAEDESPGRKYLAFVHEQAWLVVTRTAAAGEPQRSCAFHIQHSEQLVAFEWYNNSIALVLAIDGNQSVLAILPLPELEAHLDASTIALSELAALTVASVDAKPLISQFRKLETGASALFVGSKRNLASVLLPNKRSVVLLDLLGEEDDSEDEEDDEGDEEAEPDMSVTSDV